MDGKLLSRETVVPLLSSDDLPLLRVLVNIIAKHPGWADDLVKLLSDVLADRAPLKSGSHSCGVRCERWPMRRQFKSLPVAFWRRRAHAVLIGWRSWMRWPPLSWMRCRQVGNRH